MPWQACRPVAGPSTRHSATRAHPRPFLALVRALGRGGDGAIQLRVWPCAQSASRRVEGVGGGRSGKGLDLCVGLRLEGGEGAGGEGGREWSYTCSTTHMMVRRFNCGEVWHRLEGVMWRALSSPKLRTDTLACRQFLRPTELVFEEIHPQTWDWFTSGTLGRRRLAALSHLSLGASGWDPIFLPASLNWVKKSLSFQARWHQFITISNSPHQGSARRDYSHPSTACILLCTAGFAERESGKEEILKFFWIQGDPTTLLKQANWSLF